MKTTTLSSIKQIFATIAIAAITLVATNKSFAQQIAINQGSFLVMNGNAQLVVNNAGFKNNGSFAAGNGTVTFSGYADTAISNISGNDTTTFNNLTISKAAYGIALKAGADVNNTLTVAGGFLYTDSNLTLKSSSSLTARVAPVATGSNIIGKTNVERYIPARRAWRLMTAPLTDANTIYKTWQNAGVASDGKGTYITGPNAAAANGLDVSPQNNTSMKTWNAATQAYGNVNNTLVSISAGKNGSADNTGYFLFVRGDRNANNFSTATSNVTTLTSTGRLQVGNQSFNASSTSGAMTLVGNPYASPIDFNNVAKSNLMNRFYVWDATINTLGGYVMIDDLTYSGTFTKSVAASNQSKDIQSGQAFFVQTNTNGAASITFNENSKSDVNNNTMFRPATPNSLPSQFLRTNLYLVNTDNSLLLADGLFAEFNDAFSDSVLLEDAPKFSNINENIALVRNNNVLAAERRPIVNITDTIYLKLWKTTARKYQFEFIPTNLNVAEIILQDSYLNTSTNLSLVAASKINFTIDANAASAATNRFRIVFKNATVLPVTISSVKAAQLNNNIAVEWKVENEINILKYEVEKSTSGTVFTSSYSVNVNGSANANNTYNWLDVNAVQGNNFYRIKTYSNNGEVKYSAIVKVNINSSKTSSMKIYPNPVTNNTINLQLANQPKGNYLLKLTNNIGQTIYTTSMQSNSINSTLSINIPGKLTSGVYNLEVNTPDNKKSTQSVIVE
jgi:hypothetical protein